jgi:hypothetical protein
VIRYFVETEINIFDVDCVSLKSLAENYQCSVVNSISEIVLIISLDLNIDGVVFIVGFLEVSAEGFVRFDVRLLAHFPVLS